MFFRVLEVLFIPIIYDRIKTRNQKLFALSVITCWGFVVLTWVYAKDTYYPFRTIFGDLM